jgi:hypothetical protein
MNKRDDTDPPEPEGRFAGLPYDLRRPNNARIRARAWNPDDPHVFIPKVFAPTDDGEDAYSGVT